MPEGMSVIMEAVDAHVAHLASINLLMEEAAEIVYAATKVWMESSGDGSWAKLAPSTVEAKTSQGALEPERILYFWGNLYESATSKTGPNSFYTPAPDGVVFGVDMEKRGYQVAEVLAMGSDATGPAHNEHLPARPIWPPLTSMMGQEIAAQIADLLLGRTSLSPAFPGANVTRMPGGSPGGSGGQFASMK